jgi:hypothetical protein
MYLISLHGHGRRLLAGASGLPTECTAGTKKPSSPSCLQRGLAHPGHDLHRDHDVGAVGDLDAERADLRAERAHAERHDVHGAAAHAPSNRPCRSAHLGGSSQLLVGPASAGSLEQMKVRLSTRATSLGSEAA